MFTTVTEWRTAARTNPFAAAIVALVLLRERVEKALHQLVGVEVLEHLALFVGQLFEVLRVVQPVEDFVFDRK